VKVTIVCVGPIKKNEYLSLGDEYLKRLKKYMPIHLQEIKADKIPETAKKNEAKRILNYLSNKGFYTISLCEEGKNIKSKELSDLINQKAIDSKEVCFIIGGTDGLDDTVKNKSDLKLSLSKLTFTREMAWFILLEQLYRSMKIMRGEPYHR